MLESTGLSIEIRLNNKRVTYQRYSVEEGTARHSYTGSFIAERERSVTQGCGYRIGALEIIWGETEGFVAFDYNFQTSKHSNHTDMDDGQYISRIVDYCKGSVQRIV